MIISFLLTESFNSCQIESFPLHGAFGVISASLERLPKFPVHNIPFEQVHKFQNFAFTEILGLNNRLLQTRMELPLFILPLLSKEFLDSYANTLILIAHRSRPCLVQAYVFSFLKILYC